MNSLHQKKLPNCYRGVRCKYLDETEVLNRRAQRRQQQQQQHMAGGMNMMVGQMGMPAGSRMVPAGPNNASRMPPGYYVNTAGVGGAYRMPVSVREEDYYQPLVFLPIGGFVPQNSMAYGSAQNSSGKNVNAPIGLQHMGPGRR